MNLSCQLFVWRKAAIQNDGGPSLRSFLIIVPEGKGEAGTPGELVATLARHLNQNGYAYVARAGQKETEDDEFGVRYLPLHGSLPSFGVMSAVIVIHDEAWAGRASSTYPDADIFLISLATTFCAQCSGESSTCPQIPMISRAVRCGPRKSLCFVDADNLSANGRDE